MAQMGSHVRHVARVGTALVLWSFFVLVTAKLERPTTNERDSAVFLHELKGRPIMVHSKADIELSRAVDVHSLRATLDHQGRKAGRRTADTNEVKRPYLIRVDGPVRRVLLSNLFAEAGKENVKYLPHDSYVAMLSKDAMERISVQSGVTDIFYLPDVLKVQPVLYPLLDNRSESSSRDEDGQQSIRRRKHVPDEASEQATKDLRSRLGQEKTALPVLLLSTHSEEEQDTLMAHIRDTAAVQSATFTWASAKKIVAEVENEHLEALVAWLSEQHWVLYVGVEDRFFANNYYGARGNQQSCTSSCVSDGHMPAPAATPIWDAGLRGQGQVIGVSDTGLDKQHCFFRDSAESVAVCTGSTPQNGCTNFNHRKVVSYRGIHNTVENFARGHGTHVAGSAAGSREGVEDDGQGAAPDAKLCFDDIGKIETGQSTETISPPVDWEASLFSHCYEKAGSRIYSMSWQAGGNDLGLYNEKSYETDSFLFNHDDMVITSSVGNEGPGLGRIQVPGSAKNTLSSGATYMTADFFDANSGYGIYGYARRYAHWASRGPTHDGRWKPEVSCMGEWITSASSASSASCGAHILQGVSMSTPLCAGAAAIVRQYFEQGWYGTGVQGSAAGINPTAALVKAMMINSATTQSLDYWYQEDPEASSQWILEEHPVPMNQHTGFGRVDLTQVLWLGALTPGFKLTFLNKERVQPGVYRQWCVQSSDGNLRVTLVWTDPTGLPNAGRNLVNNLDLQVINPSGAVLPGNDGAAADDVNNAEHVTVSAGAVGLYQIRVLGSDVPIYTDPGQSFSLVIVGDHTVQSCASSGYIEGVPTDSVRCQNGVSILAGASLPGTLNAAAGSVVEVYLASDLSVQKRGFYAIYNAPDYVDQGCGSNVVLTSHGGRLSTSSGTCSWVLAPAGTNDFTLHVMSRTATALVAASSALTSSVPVTFAYCSNAACTTFAGSAANPSSGIYTRANAYGVKVTTSGGAAKIMFTTSKVYSCVGGEVDHGMITDEWAVLTDGPGNYLAFASCRYTIAPASGAAIQVRYLDFEVEDCGSGQPYCRECCDTLTVAVCAFEQNIVEIADDPAATTSGVQPSSSSSSTPTPSTSTSTPAPSTSTTPPLPTSSSSTSAAPTSSSSSSTPIQTTERVRAFPDTSAALASCTLNATWEEVISWMESELSLAASDKSVRTAGLGTRTQLGVFEAYLCLGEARHACALPGDPVCFVYDETTHVFIPWARSSELGIYNYDPAIA